MYHTGTCYMGTLMLQSQVTLNLATIVVTSNDIDNVAEIIINEIELRTSH